jgi:hypothetical protein
MIKVGYCVAYDWYLLNYSIPQVYESANVICLSIDKNRQSWSGKPFNWDQQGFEAMLKKLDPLGKIQLFEEDFYQPQLSPMQNEVRQRNMIAHFMGKGGWHIQLDADEYFLDFKGFTNYLKKLGAPLKVNVSCPWVTLYKQVPDGFLWVKPGHFEQVEFIQIATTDPCYEYGRRNGYFNIITDYALLHQSWARTEQEIWEKLTNWGHALDFDVQEYFNLWKMVNSDNYKTYKDFHHLNPGAWPKLAMAKGESINCMISQGKNDFKLPISKRALWMANSRFYSRIKKLFNLIYKN